MDDGTCKHCRDMDYCFDFCRSAMDYRAPMPDLIHALKYRGMATLGTYLGTKMADYAKDYSAFYEYSLVVPVPLHPVRKRERGYNQSAIIAQKLARDLGKSYLDCVQRKRYTRSQTTLERKARLSNLSGAFRVKDKSAVKGKCVILVDDVFTTGSTLNEVSRALYEAGADKVAGYTATRA